MKRWKTNKTQPKGLKGEMIIIFNSNGFKWVGIESAFVNSKGQLCITEYGVWEKVKKEVQCWAYVNEFFKKEFLNEKR